MIHYTAWINLFVLALKLFPSFNEVDNIQVKTSWRNLELIGMHGNVQAMHVEFVTLESNRTLLTYIFIPWIDMSLTNQQNDISSFFGLPEMLCVSPFAIINQVTTPDETEHEVVLKEKITTFIEEFFEIEKYAKRIDYQEGYTLGDNYQVMSMRQYPYLADLSIAVPGSAHLDPMIFKNEFSNTMIYVSMIPDIGKVISSWIKAGDAAELYAVIDIQDELLRKLEDYVLSASSANDIDERIKYYEQYKNELIDLFISYKLHVGIQFFYCDLLRRLLYIPAGQQTDKEIYTHSVYGNYQPKKTPDVVTDYMPGILNDLKKIPEAKFENLAELIDMFDAYLIKARKNPGKTVEGNIILGGLPEQYEPSKEELMLAEIGECIRAVIDSVQEQKLRTYCKDNELNGKEVAYKKYTFIHYDVMGSGRFFYVDSVENVHLILP